MLVQSAVTLAHALPVSCLRPQKLTLALPGHFPVTSQGRLSPLNLSQAESPTKAAERAAAAWTPPPLSSATKAVDEVRARPRRSASSYAAYTAADTAAFEAAFGAHLAPPKDVSPPSASPAKVGPFSESVSRLRKILLGCAAHVLTVHMQLGAASAAGHWNRARGCQAVRCAQPPCHHLVG